MITKRKYFKVFLSSLLLVLLISSITVLADVTLPTPTSNKYINDYVGIVNVENTRNIISIGKELEGKTGAQAIAVLINSTNGVPIETYGNKLFRTWGIGAKGKDNGLLILVAVNDKTWRVEVGRGLEGAIPDALSNRIMESIARPSFIEDNYGKGLMDSYSAFSDEIAKEYGVTLDKSLNIVIPNRNTVSNSRKGGSPVIWIIVLVFFFVDLIFNRGRIISTILQIAFWSNIGRRGPRGGGGGYGGGGFGGGSSNGGGSSGRW
ncbi:TPM domain-containing protein [Clostridium sp. LP20]|uniref:TPM domain-containing protein n=1 Tax=Clostridium sp. LP20 TaxID=3418665 RepID=UPI003EE7AC82